MNDKLTAVIVNTTDWEHINAIKLTIGQLEDLVDNGNIGLNTRSKTYKFKHILRIQSEIQLQ